MDMRLADGVDTELGYPSSVELDDGTGVDVLVLVLTLYYLKAMNRRLCATRVNLTL